MILDIKIETIAELVTGLSDLRNKTPKGEPIWFRGHANKKFKLLPSIARNPKGLDLEGLLIKKFKQNAYPFRTLPPKSEWEWLFLMQHFGVPTRLLDWTESPLAGLYFAINDLPENEAEDAHLWALLPAKYNSDFPRIRFKVNIDIPSFEVDKVLEDYRPDIVTLETATTKFPVAAIAHRQNERIMAQLGVFTIMHRDATPIENIADDCLARFTIPTGAKIRLREELQSLHITRMTLFPELASVATLTKEFLP
ncbi:MULTISPECIES: FRG domain-containing protein [Corallococcus]|uniref:FRG domain-containing protein n=1 Tax=Corallococcus TaxID=83461 RepID=UPI00148CA348|nr:FRG domain-containing protein [Corallococcus carmarthensis]NOK20777.1 FRG domain-containing protein [Corallococcus carmarthensis]